MCSASPVPLRQCDETPAVARGTRRAARRWRIPRQQVPFATASSSMRFLNGCEPRVTIHARAPIPACWIVSRLKE